MSSKKENFQVSSIVVTVLALSFLAVPAVFAQVDTGAILGTVTDQSGAVVPDARVTLLNEGTGSSLTTTSGAEGSYIFTPIRIGTYTVTVEKEGFQTVTRLHVPLHVTQQVKVDVRLAPGRVTQKVEVTGAPPLLDTQTSSVGQTFGSQAVNDLPLNGRNYTFLAQLGAGVNQGRGALADTGGFVANGLTLLHNNYILDGIDNNNDTVNFLNGASYAVLPPTDAIQEFRAQTSNFSAEFGRAGGAVINAAIKSGTNHVHGSLWEFVRNDKFDAANFFENSPIHINKGEFRRSQFGGSIGGPVIIPHIYHGRDKTFFFGDFEATRIRQGAPQLANVTTSAERASGYTNLQELVADQSGTQNDLLGRTFPLGTVFDPATTRTVTAGQVDPVTGLLATSSGFVRDPFFTGSLAGKTDFTTPAAEALLNLLPAGRLDPNAIKLLNLYPAPTSSGIFNNFSVDRAKKDDTGHFDVRIDHNFSEKNLMFGRVSYSDRPYFLPGPFTGVAEGGGFGYGTFKDVNFNSALSETHSFTPTLINELRFGYSRIHTTQLQAFPNSMGIPAQYGIQGIPQRPMNGGLPLLNISGLTNLGAGSFLPQNLVSDTTQLAENLTKVYRSHTPKGGFQMQYLRHPWLAPAWPRGQFAFAGAYTEVPNTGNGNTGLAQLLLSPTATTVPNGFNDVGGAQTALASNFQGPDEIRHIYGAYFQDDWKVSHKLTLNLGVRWEFFSQLGENYGAVANLIQGPPGTAQYLITTRRRNTPLSPSFLSALAKDGISLGYSSQFGLTNAPKDDFAPRVGLAYQMTPRLVAHASYGIFYAGSENLGGNPADENYPFIYNLLFFAPDPAHPMTYPDGSIGTLENGLAGVSLSPTTVNGNGLTLASVQTGWKTPYVQEYSLNFQYELSPNQTVQLGYVGNTSRHLVEGTVTNYPSVILPPGTSPQLYAPFPDLGIGALFLTSQGESYYNGLQLNFERRFTSGVSMLANYTYSKCRGEDYYLININNAVGLPAFRAPTLRGFGVQGDYGLCGDDVTNVLHYSGTYHLPFGTGKRFGRSATGALNQVIGRWSINWIATLEGGFPFSVPCPIPTTSDFGCDALLVPGQDIYGGPHNIQHFLNPNAFAQPPVATTVGQTDYAPLGGRPTQAHGPGFHRLDFSMFKSFRTSDKTYLEFRAEFFNLTNTPQFAPPTFLDFTNKATFGQITSLRDGANDPRQIQFALKFYW